MWCTWLSVIGDSVSPWHNSAGTTLLCEREKWRNALRGGGGRHSISDAERDSSLHSGRAGFPLVTTTLNALMVMQHAKGSQQTQLEDVLWPGMLLYERPLLQSLSLWSHQSWQIRRTLILSSIIDIGEKQGRPSGSCWTTNKGMDDSRTPQIKQQSRHEVCKLS